MTSFVYADPESKQVEQDVLKTFASNFINYCNTNAVSANKACKRAKITNSVLYQMREGKFTRFVSVYTLCVLCSDIGVPLVDLLTPRPEGEASPQQTSGKRKTYKKK